MSAESDEMCKLDRVAEKWELSALDDRLQSRRTEGDSLRDLEQYVNTRVVRAAMQATGMDAIDGEASNLYRLLTDDSVSTGKRVTVESRLERNGVDPESLRSDFVSYQTVRTHLRDCLDVATSRDTDLDTDEARTTVHKLLSRTEAVTERTLERLETAGRLTIPQPSVSVSLRVSCSACGDDYTFSQLLARGGCSCRTQE
jgi:hypothetical protein